MSQLVPDFQPSDVPVMLHCCAVCCFLMVAFPVVFMTHAACMQGREAGNI